MIMEVLGYLGCMGARFLMCSLTLALDFTMFQGSAGTAHTSNTYVDANGGVGIAG